MARLFNQSNKEKIMPTFMCRWENGDVSFVTASTKLDAVDILDEVAGAGLDDLVQVKDFSVHFGLGDDGELFLEGFGELTTEDVEEVYPILTDTKSEIYTLEEENQFEFMTQPSKEKMIAAVKTERERLQPKVKSKSASS
jgi:hypothetical protein